jgi:hypothetical protein
MSSEEQEKSEALYRAVNEQLERQNQILAAQYDLAKKMAEAQGINISSLNKTKTSYDGLYGSTNKQSAAATANAEALKVMQEASANFSKALTNSTASAVSFGKALLSNEQGFAKYNQTLSSAGDAAMALGKNFGLLGMGLGIAIKGLTMAAEQFTKQADNTLKATDNLSKLGGAGALTADQVLTMGHKAGLTSSNLDIMTKAAAKANTGMAGLGGTVGDGIKAFGDMTAVTKEQRMAFQRMGVSQEELMSQQADYIKLQELSGINLADQAKQGKNLKAASLDYAENLVRLSTLTGKSADDLAKEKMLANEVYEEQIQTQMEQAKIRQLRAEGRNDEAADLQRQQENRKRAAEEYVHSFGKEQGLQMARAARTGTFDQSTAGLATMGFDPAAQKRKIEQAKSAEEVDAISAANREDMKKKREQMLLSAGSAVVYGGESVGKALGLGGTETAQAYGRMGSRDEKAALKDAQGKTAGLASGEKGAGGAAATDPAQVARNNLTEAEIAAKVALDKFIASYNPLLKGFDAGTIAALALAAAATAAALALGKMAASALMNKMGGGGPNIPDKKGKGKDKPDRPRDSKGRFVKGASAVKDAGALSKMAGTAGRFAGPAAGVVAVGAGAYTAYQGAKEVDEQVKRGELTKDQGTVKKSEAVGTGVGQAAGGAAGAWGGAAAGAAIGSVVPVVGTIIGGLLGAAVGGWLGSKGGEIVGEKVGKSVGKSMVDKPAVAGAPVPGAPEAGNVAKIIADKAKEDEIIAKQAREDAKKLTKASETQEVTISTLNKTLLSTNIALTNLTASITNLNKPTATSGMGSNASGAGGGASASRAGGGGGGGGGGAASSGGGGGGGGVSVPSKPAASGSGGGSSWSEKLLGGGSGSKNSAKPPSDDVEGKVGGGGGGSPAEIKMNSADAGDAAKGPRKKTDGIIVHHTGGRGVQGAISTLKARGLGYHYMVDQDGSVTSFVPDDQTAWHAGKTDKQPGLSNSNSVSISLVSKDDSDVSPAQLKSGFELGKSLMSKYGASMVYGHGETSSHKQATEGKTLADALRSGKLPTKVSADAGGLASGPETGYPATLHGNEAILPLNPDSIITKLLNTSESQLKSEMNNNITTNTSSSDDGSNQIMADLYIMMEEKFDAMINALEDGNSQTEKLVKFSAV